LYVAVPSAAKTPAFVFAQIPPPWLPAVLELMPVVPLRMVIPSVGTPP